MLSISLSKAAKEGSSYFEKDAYYNTDEVSSQWYGNGAAALGLSGHVVKGDFDTVLNGFSLDGNPLVKNAGSADIKNDEGEVIKKGRSAYIDMTFSAPKSVSLMSYTDERIEKAHNAAVERALIELEKNYAYTRKVDQNSEIETVQSDNLVMARINHHESRELDPQLHSHIVVMNLTKGEDEKWRSIEAGKIYRDQLYLGQLYKNELAIELEKIGYQIDVTDREKGAFEIRGVSKEIRDEFSTRRQQVLEAKEKYEDYNVSEAKKSEYACLDSRKNKSDSSIEEIRKDVEIRLEQYGLNLAQIKESSLNEPRVKTESLNIEDCVSLAIEQVSDKQSAFTQEDILQYALKGAIGAYTAQELKSQIKKTAGVTNLGIDGRYKDSYLTTQDIKNAEASVLFYAAQGKGTSEVRISPERLAHHLERIESAGKILSKGQRDALEMICTTKDRISLVQGDAGAGKSFAMGEVKRTMQAEGFIVRGFAPTGKAAQELEKEDVESMTVDKYLSSPYHQGGVGQNEVWLIDEAGMMGSKKMDAFLKHAWGKNAKVVLIGDTKQFQAVEQGKIFQDLQDYTNVSKTEITEVKRQETDHSKEVVAAIKEKDFEKAFGVLERNDAFKEITSRSSRLDQIRTEYMADQAKGVSSVVLTANNADKNELNGAIRSALENAGVVEGGSTFKMYEKKDIDSVSRNFSSSYKDGLVLVFKKDCADISVTPRYKDSKATSNGVEAIIKGVGAQKNTLSVEYYDRNAKQYKTADIDLKKHCAKFDIYEKKEKRFGAGDSVIFTKNDSRVKVSNGETGKIKSIDARGSAIVGIGKEGKSDYREVILNLNNRGDKGYTYLDHAYCLTNHKSQGSSYQKVIVNADVSNQKTNSNAFYVQATRMKQDISIYTSDKESLMKQAQVRQDKASTLNPVFAQYTREHTVSDYQWIMSRIEDAQIEAAKQEAAKQEAAKQEAVKQEAVKEKAVQEQKPKRTRDYDLSL